MLKCLFCWFGFEQSPEEDDPSAIFIVNGQSVCTTHATIVQTFPDFGMALSVLKDERRAATSNPNNGFHAVESEARDE